MKYNHAYKIKSIFLRLLVYRHIYIKEKET